MKVIKIEFDFVHGFIRHSKIFVSNLYYQWAVEPWVTSRRNGSSERRGAYRARTTCWRRTGGDGKSGESEGSTAHWRRPPGRRQQRAKRRGALVSPRPLQRLVGRPFTCHLPCGTCLPDNPVQAGRYSPLRSWPTYRPEQSHLFCSRRTKYWKKRCML